MRAHPAEPVGQRRPAAPKLHEGRVIRGEGGPGQVGQQRGVLDVVLHHTFAWNTIVNSLWFIYCTYRHRILDS